jgi:hypothetical protein
MGMPDEQAGSGTGHLQRLMVGWIAVYRFHLRNLCNLRFPFLTVLKRALRRGT